jgi:hypothetical protein
MKPSSLHVTHHKSKSLISVHKDSIQIQIQDVELQLWSDPIWKQAYYSNHTTNTIIMFTIEEATHYNPIGTDIM